MGEKQGVDAVPMKQDFTKYQPGEPPAPPTPAEDLIVSSDTLREDRLPPGQTRTRKWPILHWKRVPSVERADWSFFVRGEVDQPLVIDWAGYSSLRRVKLFSDFHCVTRWSRLGNLWEGVPIREILQQVQVRETAHFAIVHGYDDGFTTNLPIEWLMGEDVILADTHDGEPISADHGGPVRLIVPRLYAWKSAKWVSGIVLSASDEPGTWERSGYHHRGDPWTQERHSW